MDRLIDHKFVAGQRWKNDGFILYILSVNDDYTDVNDGKIVPGKICVTDEKPFPEKKMTATDLHPKNMQEVIEKGGYTLMETGWMEEFNLQKEAIVAARAPHPEPIKPPKTHGLGAMMMK